MACIQWFVCVLQSVLGGPSQCKQHYQHTHTHSHYHCPTFMFVLHECKSWNNTFLSLPRETRSWAASLWMSTRPLWRWLRELFWPLTSPCTWSRYQTSNPDGNQTEERFNRDIVSLRREEGRSIWEEQSTGRGGQILQYLLAQYELHYFLKLQVEIGFICWGAYLRKSFKCFQSELVKTWT